jgi:hypothetical protein
VLDSRCLIVTHNMLRCFQFLLIVSATAFSWLAMQVVHEFGHVIHAWVSGGTVDRVHLQPVDISRTDLVRNPHPLFVAWGGAIWGCVLPLCLFGLVRWLRPAHAYLPAFFAGFCLIANGAYLAVGSWSGVGDAGDLLRHGTPRWLLVAFGLPACGLGFYLWHGLGPSFGLGAARGQVDRRAAWGVTFALIVLLLVELLAGGPAIRG